MTKLKMFHIRNEMIAANFLANLIGVFFVQILISKADSPIPDHILQNPDPAKEILDSVFADLDKFRYPLEKEDDVTLVVIKVDD